MKNSCDLDLENQLYKFFDNQELASVTVLTNEGNLGFAKGNNVGYEFARAELNPDYIIATNNDVVFSQVEICSIISNLFNREPFHVLGPDVYNPLLGIHQSPRTASIPIDGRYIEALKTEFEENLRKSYDKEALLRLKYRLLNTGLGRKVKVAKAKKVVTKYPWDEQRSNVELMGACVIYSNLYIKEMPWAFYPETFMYLEELISLYVSQIKGFRHVYNPSIQVMHMHGISTVADYPDEFERYRFLFRESLKSMAILQRLMQDGLDL